MLLSQASFSWWSTCPGCCTFSCCAAALSLTSALARCPKPRTLCASCAASCHDLCDCAVMLTLSQDLSSCCRILLCLYEQHRARKSCWVSRKGVYFHGGCGSHLQVQCERLHEAGPQCSGSSASGPGSDAQSAYTHQRAPSRLSTSPRTDAAAPRAGTPARGVPVWDRRRDSAVVSVLSTTDSPSEARP